MAPGTRIRRQNDIDEAWRRGCGKRSELPFRGKKRVAIAKTLIQPADLLILDEPTNHLDNETIEWLEGYLSGYPGSVVLVTHDRYF